MANELTPIAASEWSAQKAAHLLSRAGFGGTPEQVARLAAMTPAEAVRTFIAVDRADNRHLAPFDHSGVHDPGLEPFPESRPAATDLAKQTGQSLGVKVKASGNRRIQPVANRFFYWLRASYLETGRVSYWWANRMVASNAPLQEKMALFWHGHFAVNEDKVRDYRKLLIQLQLFQDKGLGSFRDLTVAVAQDPAMLCFLDARKNVKGAPNENFAREIMELFTMGVGHYSEKDVREAARAFTGWDYEDTRFVVRPEAHDEGQKTFLGRTGNFDGVQVIDIIMQQPVTAEFTAGKLYRFFVREDLDPQLQKQLGDVLRRNDYRIAPFLETVFLSRDFYSDASMGAVIHSPVSLAVATYRKLGQTSVPGVPDFNAATGALGQRLLAPPTVAGWAQGRAWITPGLLLERGNFARDVLFPDINFVPPDRYARDPEISRVADRIRDGLDITNATSQAEGVVVAEANRQADRDEDFNTRYASFRGWQMAIQRVKAIPRDTAHLDLSSMVRQAKLQTTAETVDYFTARFLLVPPGPEARARLVRFLDQDLGTPDMTVADTYMEDSLRMLAHLIMSLPEYQLS
ncbi:MAG: hypothetical protein BGN86_14590 [Caulobacterales bacterium 68-7]|nr:DUF1800 domain-containing protein [Caulobacterales bacterium]OJU09737.1 MAG: hypothetical protein BGN86_14590 [Caulobacterales bacterium 68-7]